MRARAGAIPRLVLLLVVVAAGCSSESEQEDAVDFCTEAEAFIYDRSVTDVASFDADFFAAVDERLAGIEAAAPDEVAADVSALRTGFADSDMIFGAFDYDVTDPQLADALQQVDNETMIGATDRIERYLIDSCGIEERGTIDDGEIADIIEAFGVDRELAECLNAELGDIANIDSADLTPELLQQPVCGTSLIAILSGAGAGQGG